MTGRNIIKNVRLKNPERANTKQKSSIREAPFFINPKYMCPAPGNKENTKVQKLLFFIAGISFQLETVKKLLDAVRHPVADLLGFFRKLL